MTNDKVDTARDRAALMYGRDECSRSLGIEIDVPEAGVAVATMTVREDMLNGFGVCHGGMIFLLADTAFAFACNAHDRETLSVAASIDWLRPVTPGTELTARAEPVELSGRHGYFAVRVSDAAGDAVALFHGHSVSRDRPLLDRPESDT